MKRFPNAFVILLGVIILSWILTFIIPQGSYERVTDSQSGQTTVIGGSYQEISAESLSFFDLILGIPQGLASRADLIVLILLMGGSFYVIEKTGALGQGL
ncbi:MAG: YfcC family protein, partial [Robiginitalea sp.]